MFWAGRCNGSRLCKVHNLQNYRNQWKKTNKTHQNTIWLISFGQEMVLFGSSEWCLPIPGCEFCQDRVRCQEKMVVGSNTGHLYVMDLATAKQLCWMFFFTIWQWWQAWLQCNLTRFCGSKPKVEWIEIHMMNALRPVLALHGHKSMIRRAARNGLSCSLGELLPATQQLSYSQSDPQRITGSFLCDVCVWFQCFLGQESEEQKAIYIQELDNHHIVLLSIYVQCYIYIYV